LINFISNLPADLRTGGFSSMNAMAFDVIRRDQPVRYVGPVNPSMLTWQKALSKLHRVSGFAGDFFHYSEERLAKIARGVETRCAFEAKLDFFHGFTPWVLTSPKRPYIAWSDCSFRDYIQIYHAGANFRSDDIWRIEQTEATWMRGARRIAFTNSWAADRASREYRLDPKRVDVVGIYGEVDLPEQDRYSGAAQFVFVSTNFRSKGGPVVLAAFQQLRETHPEATLVIVGDCPLHAKSLGGVTVLGFLRKEHPEEIAKYREVLAGARALVHPTNSDIAPLVIVEAAYFGCPAIASRRFAIPELVDDGRSGILLNNPRDASELAHAMRSILTSESDYVGMRNEAWRKGRKEHSKNIFECRFLAFLRAALG
jgi:glycosyltransferase involved in cell wall biosynthesis